MKRLLLSALVGLSLVAATTAFAGEGYVTASVSLRAGPDPGYPPVVRLHRGTPVGIEGCVDGWSWCDVVVGDERGWVPGAYLQEEYDGRRVLVRDYGVRIGIPVIGFEFGNYWDNYYRGRSWYGHRDRWSHVHPHYAYYGRSGGSHEHGGSYGYSGGSYSHSGGSYDRSGASYSGTRDSHYRDTRRAESGTVQPGYSTGYRSHDGTRQSGVVTTQRSYETRQSQPAYSTGYRSHDGTRHSGVVTTQRSYETRQAQPAYAPSQQRVTAESRGGQGYTNADPAPPRSASGEQHSAAGQQRAADVHARNAARHSEHARDKSDQDKDHQNRR